MVTSRKTEAHRAARSAPRKHWDLKHPLQKLRAGAPAAAPNTHRYRTAWLRIRGATCSLGLWLGVVTLRIPTGTNCE